MPHADSSLLPSTIRSKQEFWAHVLVQLEFLLAEQRNWVPNLANAASLIFNSLLDFSDFFGKGDRSVNWCGFYIDSRYFPLPLSAVEQPVAVDSTEKLLLGPFCGKPACQYINTSPGKARGVCADAFLNRNALLVPDVDLYPGHIACDGDTKSEIVCPLMIGRGDGELVVGVLDLDCLAVDAFDDEDKSGLEKIAALVASSCDW